MPQMRTLDPATHAYSFWEGVPGGARTAFGALFAASATLTGVAVVQRAVRLHAAIRRFVFPKHVLFQTQDTNIHPFVYCAHGLAAASAIAELTAPKQPAGSGSLTRASAFVTSKAS